MTSSATETTVPVATGVSVTDDTLTVDLSDGRTLSVPLAWYPRLLHATSHERGHWKLVARGEGVHWPDVDEDISVASVIAGRPSDESAASLQRWLAARKT
jgi:Protein of unknown function (DUF2442)